jgi:hypothetical protein
VKPRSAWISLLGLCVLTAIGAALALAMIFAGGAVALAGHRAEAAQVGESSPQSLPTDHPSVTKFTGMVTCSRCRARHMRDSRMSAEECVRACVRAGAVYVLVDGDRSYILIGGSEFLSKFAGQRANIMGTRQNGAILVDSASSLF